MFTGLVQTTGTLRRRERRGPGFHVHVASALGSLDLGESIAVNGACLTVVGADKSGFSVDVSLETAECTTLGRLPIGCALNLERSLAIGDRLGGHLVTGHVDGIARVGRTQVVGEALIVGIEVSTELLPFIAPKGSVCLDGVSLTVNRTLEDGFEIMLIPHTLAVTTLKTVRAGQELNLEVDLIARYVVHYLAATGAAGSGGSIAATLERAGLM